jgi:hypothetical protein
MMKYQQQELTARLWVWLLLVMLGKITAAVSPSGTCMHACMLIIIFLPTETINDETTERNRFDTSV